MIITRKDNINPKVNRDLYNICDKYLKSDDYRLFTITGQRRLGKTTILKTLNNAYENAIMITLEQEDNMKEFIKFIDKNLDKYDIFLIDEFCLNQNIFNNAQSVFEILINHRKKAVITGTYSLALLYLRQDQSYGRTINYNLPNLSYLEYIDIFGVKEDSYLEYINFTDFYNTFPEDYLKFMVHNICNSYDKYCSYNELSNKMRINELLFYIHLILYKMVINSDMNFKQIMRIEGISDDEFNSRIVDWFHITSGYKGNIKIDTLKLILNQLSMLGIIKFINPFGNSSVYKNIITDFVVKKYMYDIIEDRISNDLIKNFKITHYGNFYENIMNMQVAIYSDNTYTQNYYKDNQYEIDDVVIMKDKIMFVDYRSGKYMENFAFSRNKEVLDDTCRDYYNKPSEYIYVSGKPNERMVDDVVFLTMLRNKYIDKFETDVSRNSNGMFNWEV